MSPTNLTDADAIEIDQWLEFASCHHLGYISTGVGEDSYIVYWDKTRMVPGGMPKTFCGKPMEIKRIGRPILE